VKQALAVLAAAAALVAGSLFPSRLRPGARPPSGRAMLAVLPVQNLTGDPKQEFISDGLTEELITQLGGLNAQQLGVIARASAMSYKGTHKKRTRSGASWAWTTSSRAACAARAIVSVRRHSWFACATRRISGRRATIAR
jgi:hypothetical protein